MAQFILRDIPEGLWTRVTARATRDGWPLRILLMQLLEDFASSRVTPGGGRPPLLIFAWLRQPFRQLMLDDPSAVSLGAREQWERLRAIVAANGPQDESRTSVMDAVEPGRRGGILSWLERTMVPNVFQGPPPE